MSFVITLSTTRLTAFCLLFHGLRDNPFNLVVEGAVGILKSSVTVEQGVCAWIGFTARSKVLNARGLSLRSLTT